MTGRHELHIRSSCRPSADQEVRRSGAAEPRAPPMPVLAAPVAPASPTVAAPLLAPDSSVASVSPDHDSPTGSVVASVVPVRAPGPSVHDVAPDPAAPVSALWPALSGLPVSAPEAGSSLLIPVSVPNPA